MAQFFWGVVICLGLVFGYTHFSKPETPHAAAVRKAAEYKAKLEYEAEREAECKPWRVAEAPDGTTLWKVSTSCSRIGEYPVYFSTAGTHSFIRKHGMAGKVPTSRTIPVSVPST